MFSHSKSVLIQFLLHNKLEMIPANFPTIPKRINDMRKLSANNLRREKIIDSADSADSYENNKQESKRRISLQKLKRMKVANSPVPQLGNESDLTCTVNEETGSIASFGNKSRAMSSFNRPRIPLSTPKTVENGFLSAYNQYSHLEKTYTKAELKEYHQLFKMFDTDNSGAIGHDKLKEAMINFGIKVNPSDVDKFIKEVDEDGNGEIDFEEFCRCMKRSQTRSKSTNEEIIKQCFEVFDQDDNGLITESEFVYIAKEVGEFTEELAKFVFGELDVSSTGHISIEQFGAIVEDYLFSDNSRAT